jgi:hypothetical protein
LEGLDEEDEAEESEIESIADKGRIVVDRCHGEGACCEGASNVII